MTTAAFPSCWSVQWHSPYTEPPDGRPRVLSERFVRWPAEDQRPPADLLAVHAANPGYAMYWGAVLPPPAPRVSQEGRAKIRQRNLRRRMEARYPMFAEEFIAAELAKRPHYFDGSDDWLPEEFRAERASLVDAATARFRRALAECGLEEAK